MDAGVAGRARRPLRVVQTRTIGVVPPDAVQASQTLDLDDSRHGIPAPDLHSRVKRKCRDMVPGERGRHSFAFDSARFPSKSKEPVASPYSYRASPRIESPRGLPL